MSDGTRRPREITRAEAASRLRAALEARGLKQSEAARGAGLSPQAISHYLAAERIPSWTRLLRLAADLGLDPCLLMPELFPASSREISDPSPLPSVNKRG